MTEPVETFETASPQKRLAFALWDHLHGGHPSAEAHASALAQVVVDAGWKPPADEDVSPTVPIALAVGRLRDRYRDSPVRDLTRDRVVADLTEALTMVVGPGPLVDHDERVRARVLDDEVLPRLARRCYLDPGAVVRRDFDFRGEGYPEPLDHWQDRAMREGLRRYRLREGEPLV